MKLLDRSGHVVTVQRRERRITPHGPVLAAVGPAVSVQCGVRALTASETADLGLTTETVYRVLAREWPGDVNSLLTYKGDQWEPIGDPLHFDGSPRTRHTQVRMKLVRDG